MFNHAIQASNSCSNQCTYWSVPILLVSTHSNLHLVRGFALIFRCSNVFPYLQGISQMGVGQNWVPQEFDGENEMYIP